MVRRTLVLVAVAPWLTDCATSVKVSPAEPPQPAQQPALQPEAQPSGPVQPPQGYLTLEERDELFHALWETIEQEYHGLKSSNVDRSGMRGQYQTLARQAPGDAVFRRVLRRAETAYLERTDRAAVVGELTAGARPPADRGEPRQG